MATQKPISTISYNTEDFLKEKLDLWVHNHIIQTYMYICHKGEDGDKDHIHLRIEPNKKLDPMDLMEELREFKIGEKKPLGCRPFRPSTEEDWFLYAVHDKDYLKLKYDGGEKGEKIPYNWQNIVVPEFYDLEIAFIRAKSKLEHTTVNMATKMQNGIKPMDLILTGENPYVVNALMRAMATNDYMRLQDEYNDAKSQLLKLEQAIYSYGLLIDEDDSGNILLRERVE